MTTLYCPNCDYDLTGLPENRCPECGKAFEPDELLARLKVFAVGPFTLLARLLVLPFFAGLIALPLTLVIAGLVGMLALVLVPLGIILGSAYTASRIAWRMKATLAVRAPHERYTWERFCGSSPGVALMIVIQIASFVGALWLVIPRHGVIPFL